MKAEKFSALSDRTVLQAVVNVRSALEHEFGRELTQQEVEVALGSLKQPFTGDGRAASPSECRSLLTFLGSDAALSAVVDEAIEDAEAVDTKDLFTVSFLALGLVLVLVKWRPKRLTVLGEKLKIQAEWEDNDVADVAKAFQLIPLPIPPSSDSPRH